MRNCFSAPIQPLAANINELLLAVIFFGAARTFRARLPGRNYITWIELEVRRGNRLTGRRLATTRKMRISSTTICRRRQPAVLDRRCRAAIAPVRTPTATSHATDSVETRPNFAVGRRNTTIRCSPCPAWQRLAQSDLDSVLQDSLVCACAWGARAIFKLTFTHAAWCGAKSVRPFWSVRAAIGVVGVTRNVMLAATWARLCDVLENCDVL